MSLRPSPPPLSPSPPPPFPSFPSPNRHTLLPHPDDPPLFPSHARPLFPPLHPHPSSPSPPPHAPTFPLPRPQPPYTQRTGGAGGGRNWTNGRGGGRSQLDSAELDVLEKAVRILHLRYRSCLRPLTKGRLPSVTELRELRVSAEALGVRSALLCLDRIPKGDPRRLALFAFRTFALRAELDAEALRDLDEPPPGNAWPVSSYRVGTPRLRALLEDMVEEVESLWNATNRTLYEVAIVLAPVLAQYALLGKAVGMAMEQYYARLTVRKHGRVVMAVGDEIILWDDGLEDVRELFLAEKAADEQPLGSAVRIDSMNDYSWFVSWNGTSAVDNIPSEVSVKKLLHSIGAPTARLAGLRAKDKGLLMGVTVPDVRIEAEKRVLAQLQWVVDGGGKLEIKAARPQHQGISMDEPEPAHEIPYEDLVEATKNWAEDLQLGEGPEPAHEIPYDDLVEATKNWSDDLQLGEGRGGGLCDCMDEPEPAHEIPYEDLVEATKNWADDLQLGEGGSAIVYKGVSPDGELWAVKRGKKGGLTRLQDYHREIEAVSKMLHPNLVRLMGFCHENEEQVLVYEYVANGTLRQHLSPLQGDTEKGVLSFEQRIEAAVGVAEALLYLHSCKPVLVHRDVKSLNVFMDDDLQPKLGDYGNLKSIGDDESATTHTRVVGTPGYLDPQYCQTSVVSVWSDVYSFGVVMLELITAKPPVLKEALSPLSPILFLPPSSLHFPFPFGVVMLELITAKPPVLKEALSPLSPILFLPPSSLHFPFPCAFQFRGGHAGAHHSQAAGAQGSTFTTLTYPVSSPLLPSLPLPVCLSVSECFGVVMLELITAKPPVLKEALSPLSPILFLPPSSLHFPFPFGVVMLELITAKPPVLKEALSPLSPILFLPPSSLHFPFPCAFQFRGGHAGAHHSQAAGAQGSN
ncbi:unnamed protein product [Closterium sp. Naga37s-1]|nr:unnamed protein product [Closterium sp. Naga37s-1]